MAADPSKPTTITIDRDTYEVLLESYTENMLRRRAEQYSARVLTDEQLNTLTAWKETK